MIKNVEVGHYLVHHTQKKERRKKEAKKKKKARKGMGGNDNLVQKKSISEGSAWLNLYSSETQTHTHIYIKRERERVKCTQVKEYEVKTFRL